jgi:amino acid permease
VNLSLAFLFTETSDESGDTIPTVFMQWGAQGLLTNRKFVTFMSSLLIMLPLSALKDLSSLDRTSLLSIIAVIVIVLLILFRAPQVADSSTFVIDKTLRWTVSCLLIIFLFA